MTTLNVLERPVVTQLSLAGSFTRVEGLGADLPIVLTAKAEAGGSYRRERYRLQQQTIREGGVFKEMRQSLPGFIRFGRLSALLRGDDSHPLNQTGIEPYDFICRGRQGLFVFHDDTRLRLVNLETGALEQTLTHAFHKGRKIELYNVHTVQYHPARPDHVLISLTGLDRVIEMNIQTLEVTWEWCPWHHGMHTNGHGLTIVDRGDEIPAFPKGTRVEYLTPEEAEKRVNANHLPERGEAWIHQVDLSGLPARLGLQKWERVKLINSAYYAEGGQKIMITFWQTGEAVCVDRSTGQATFVAQDLGGCPHSLISVGEGYFLTDTSAGKVIRYNTRLQPTFEIDFTQCPLPPGAEADSPEWVQNTHPISPELLATIDFRRTRVVVWNFRERLYTEYPVSDEWVLQSLKRIDASGLEYLGL
ncbi:MAG: hypothetical protein H6581_04825 [Bacteroidia bacterium]|nr:hypothetical protein [Bacteroidia bacterium]